MSLRIDQDHARYREIVWGTIRENLKEYIRHEYLMGREGKGTVQIPVPRIEFPRFRFSDEEGGGLGQGEGEPGTPIPGEGEQGGEAGEAGDQAGEHSLEFELELDELLDIIEDELELPRLEDRGQAKIITKRDRYTGIRRVGPNSLRHFKRTFSEALKRNLSAGSYDPARPIIVPIRDDFRFRSYKTVEEPVRNAVIIYMMDVSGSMGDEQKEIVRTLSFFLDAFLKRRYQGVESRFIIHDAVAKEVDRETFFRTRESGGTMISSAYRLAAEILERDYPASEWNIYPYHFSDGDNWSKEDTLVSANILRDKILPISNSFGYAQVISPYGSGLFLGELKQLFPDEPKIILSELRDRDAVLASIQDFLGKKAAERSGL